MYECDKCAYEGYKTCKCTPEIMNRREDIIHELVNKVNQLHAQVDDLKTKNRVLQSLVDYFKNEMELDEDYLSQLGSWD